MPDAIARVRGEALAARPRRGRAARRARDGWTGRGKRSARELAFGVRRAARRRPRDDCRVARRRAVWVARGAARGSAARAAGRRHRPEAPCRLGEAPTDRDAALRELVRSRLEALGPVTVETLARALGLARSTCCPRSRHSSSEGAVMRGTFTPDAARGGRVVRAAPARADPPLHAGTPAERDRARDARRFQTLPVPLAHV